MRKKISAGIGWLVFAFYATIFVAGIITFFVSFDWGHWFASWGDFFSQTGDYAPPAPDPGFADCPAGPRTC
jgi:hypothetical protein